MRFPVAAFKGAKNETTTKRDKKVAALKDEGTSGSGEIEVQKRLEPTKKQTK